MTVPPMTIRWYRLPTGEVVIRSIHISLLWADWYFNTNRHGGRIN